MIPDCYDAVRQAEEREKKWDDFIENFPKCACCGHSVYPGDHYHETRDVVVCHICTEELMENECILEVV